jgi:hypothetical protein
MKYGKKPAAIAAATSTTQKPQSSKLSASWKIKTYISSPGAPSRCQKYPQTQSSTNHQQQAGHTPARSTNTRHHQTTKSRPPPEPKPSIQLLTHIRKSLKPLTPSTPPTTKYKKSHHQQWNTPNPCVHYLACTLQQQHVFSFVGYNLKLRSLDRNLWLSIYHIVTR